MRKISVFWQYALSNLLTVIIPFIIVVLIFTATQKDLVMSNTQDKYNNMLNAAKNSSDTLFSAFNNTKHAIERTRWLQDLYFRKIIENETVDAELKAEVSRSLTSLYAENKGYYQVSVNLYGDTVIYSSSGSYDSAIGEEYIPLVNNFQLPFIYYNEDNPLSILEQNSSKFLIYSIPITNAGLSLVSNSPKADMNISVKTDYLLAACKRQLSDEAVLSIEYKDEGFKLFTTDISDGVKYISTTSVSRVFPDITYTLFIPENIYYSEFNSMLRKIVISLLPVSILAIALVLLFSYLNYRQIISLLYVLPSAPKTKKGRNEIDYLSNEIHTMVQKYRDVENELSANRPYITQQLFFNLLYERYDKDIENELHRQNIVFNFPQFCVITVSVLEVTYYEKQKELLPTRISQALTRACDYYLENLSGIQGYVYAISADKFGIICNFQHKRDLETFIKELSAEGIKRFMPDLEAPIFFGVGNTYRRLTDISRSFTEACYALEQGIFKNDTQVTYYSDSMNSSLQFYNYSTLDEAALGNAIQKGDVEQACSLMQDIIDRNMHNSAMDLFSAKYFLYHLLSTLIKVLRQHNYPVEDYVDMSAIGQMRNFKEIHKYLENIIIRACERNNAQLGDDTISFESALISYVKENLFRSDLSLQRVAEHFDVSLSYISQVFKKRFGESYLEYVNKCRIAYALELRQREGLSFSVISEKVGYSSFATFRRNFVKYIGTTPGTFGEGDG